MNSVVRWFVDNPIAANLLMVIIAIGGITTFPVLDKTFFPEREINEISITVPYRGASPAEVEQQICMRIEEAVSSLDGIDKLRSIAKEGSGKVIIEVEPGFDTIRMLNEVKSRVDGITTFPVESERPRVRERLYQSRVISVALAGDIGEANLKELGETVREEMSALPDVQLVELRRPRAYELGVEVSEDDLRAMGLRFEEVANVVRGHSINLPAGKIRSEGGDIQVQTRGQNYIGTEFEDITLRSNLDGGRVRLGDVATITDGFEEVDVISRFNGKAALSLRVSVTTNPDILKTSNAVNTYIDQLRTRLPPGVEVVVWRDMSNSFRGRLGTLVSNGLTGLALVFIVLLLFLRPLLAFWVCIGIGTSFLGALWFLPYGGESLNMITLFAFILILGIVVDDAIIVGESIYTHQAQGMSAHEAAVRGTHSVVKPVCFAVLTTMIVFGMFYLLPSDSPEARAMPTVVIAALFFSLVESLFILPAHLAHMKPERPGSIPWLAWLERWREKFARGMEHLIIERYQPLLRRCMTHRNITVVSFLVALSVSMAWYGGGWLASSFFPKVPSDSMVASVSMPEGVPFSELEKVMTHLESQVERLRKEYNVAGELPIIGHVEAGAYDNSVRVVVQLVNASERGISSLEMKRRWQGYIGELPQAKDFNIRSTIGRNSKAIQLQLTSPDMDTLKLLAAELKQELARYPGTYNIGDSLENPRPEIELRLKPLAETLNISLADVARQVRRAFYGEEVQRIPRQREDVRVMVRYPRDERESVDSLLTMRIRTPEGKEVPFEAIAEVNFVPGYSVIERIDRKRVAEVTAELQRGHDARAIIDAILLERVPEWRLRFPGSGVVLEGEQEERQEFTDTMTRLMMGTMALIFGLMAIAFKSYWQPILIVVAIPFGIMGAVFGHAVMGREMSMFSLLGIVACAGVVVNDNLVLVDRVNRLRAEGMALWDALVQGSSDRFRPIILTSLTTFIGLVPIMMERSVQAQFLIPMALSLAFGVLFATTVTLLFIPSLYLLCERIKDYFADT
ncbi:MAG: efflux RND transporter permease subunit, partial [Pseudomonadales bacterium]